VQERLFPHMFERDTLGWNRDDRPSADPPTIGKPYVEKIAFSCGGEPAFRQAFTALERERVLIAGI